MAEQHEPWCASRWALNPEDGIRPCDCRTPGKPPHEPSAKELAMDTWPARTRIAKMYAPPTFWARLLSFLRQ
jgi:hypothetical protein